MSTVQDVSQDVATLDEFSWVEMEDHYREESGGKHALEVLEDALWSGGVLLDGAQAPEVYELLGLPLTYEFEAVMLKYLTQSKSSIQATAVESRNVVLAVRSGDADAIKFSPSLHEAYQDLADSLAAHIIVQETGKLQGASTNGASGVKQSAGKDACKCQRQARQRYLQSRTDARLVEVLATRPGDPRVSAIDAKLRELQDADDQDKGKKRKELRELYKHRESTPLPPGKQAIRDAAQAMLSVVRSNRVVRSRKEPIPKTQKGKARKIKRLEEQILDVRFKISRCVTAPIDEEMDWDEDVATAAMNF